VAEVLVQVQDLNQVQAQVQVLVAVQKRAMPLVLVLVPVAVGVGTHPRTCHKTVLSRTKYILWPHIFLVSWWLCTARW
jgi:hypothetical protein